MNGGRITRLVVSGYKSLRKAQPLAVRPLTLLAGANSSGKSSMIQPLLLLKQTLEAPFDPGPLKIDGPNVEFLLTSQLLGHGNANAREQDLKIGIGYRFQDLELTFSLEFQRAQDGTISLERELVDFGDDHVPGARNSQTLCITEGSIPIEVAKEAARLFGGAMLPLKDEAPVPYHVTARGVRTRSFLDIGVDVLDDWESENASYGIPVSHQVARLITDVMHVPGLRDPAFARTFTRTPMGDSFPGLMHHYFASVIQHWETDSEQMQGLKADLLALDLTSEVEVQTVGDTALEVMIGRFVPGLQRQLSHMVNVADAGLGLSQVLPLLVALRAAKRDQLVVIEQPELHLHPKGIYALADVLRAAVQRGVRIVIETHSELLLLGIQTLVAQGDLKPQDVSLNRFALDGEGNTHIEQADIQQDGSFGEWPVDFLDVEMDARKRYLDATWLPLGTRAVLFLVVDADILRVAVMFPMIDALPLFLTLAWWDASSPIPGRAN